MSQEYYSYRLTYSMDFHSSILHAFDFRTGNKALIAHEILCHLLVSSESCYKFLYLFTFLHVIINVLQEPAAGMYTVHILHARYHAE